jgi:hypothetical protein
VIDILEHATIKILSIVDCDLLWNSIATDDVLLEEFLDGHDCYVGDGLHLDPLGEVFYFHYGEGVVSLCWREFANDIDAPPLYGPGWGINCEGCVGVLERWEKFLEASQVDTSLATSSIIAGQ